MGVRMIEKHSSGDFCRMYQPIRFSDVGGQKSVVASLRMVSKLDNVSQCYLFYGERGCGKTTLAKILAMSLNCSNVSENGDPCGVCESCISIREGTHQDVREINAANSNGINDVRELEDDLQTKSLFSNNKIYILDEAHMLSQQAQNGLLKSVEALPINTYIILCSTEPSKLIKTLRDRAESYKFTLLNDYAIKHIIKSVALSEDISISDDIVNVILSNSENRPRNALKILQKVSNVLKSGAGEKEVFGVITSLSNVDSKIIDLCKDITYNKTVSWGDIVATYKQLNMPIESINIVMAGWFRGCLEKAKNLYMADKYANALNLFVAPLYDIKPENQFVLNMYKAYKVIRGK